MIAVVEVHRYGQVPAGIFFAEPVVTDDANVNGKRLKQPIEVGFRVVGYDVVNISDGTQEAFALGKCLHRTVFVCTVDRRIGLESDDNVVSHLFALFEYKNVSIVAEIKCSRGDADPAFSFGFFCGTLYVVLVGHVDVSVIVTCILYAELPKVHVRKQKACHFRS